MSGRAASLAEAVLPSTVYSTTAPDDAVLASDLYTIDDAKLHLDIALNDNSDDTRIAILVSEGLGEIEARTGRKFTAHNRVAEYADQAYKWQVAVIPSDGVTGVSLVERADGNGVYTTVPTDQYELVYRNGRPLVRIIDETNAFDCGRGVLARITYASQLRLNSRMGQVLRSVMNELMRYYIMPDTESKYDPRVSRSFASAMAILRDETGIRVARQ